MNTWIKKNFNILLIIFILIQPILDLITGIGLHIFNANLTLGIIVRIILAIIITTNIINNSIGSKDHLSANSNAHSNLIANYIKKGITIGGITGTLETLDTSDATAKPEDIALGKTAYVKGEKITGTYVEPISNEDLQISADNIYYADLDSSGEISVDGVIFADLAGEAESGRWRR